MESLSTFRAWNLSQSCRSLPANSQCLEAGAQRVLRPWLSRLHPTALAGSHCGSQRPHPHSHLPSAQLCSQTPSSLPSTSAPPQVLPRQHLFPQRWFSSLAFRMPQMFLIFQIISDMQILLRRLLWPLFLLGMLLP